jgi:Condensation domain
VTSAADRWARLGSERRELLQRRLAGWPAPSGKQEGTAPLSPLQRRFWLADRLAPGDSAYHVRSAVRLRGPLDPALLRRVLEAMATRHDALRTSVRSTGGEPFQVVAPAVTVRWRRAAATEPALAELVTAEVREPFELADGPLWRVLLLDLAPGDHVLVLTLHHLVADGGSVAILEAETAALYRAWRADPGTDPGTVLPPLTADHAGFARREAARVAGDGTAKGVAYWSARLGGPPARPGLPTGHAAPGQDGPLGGRHGFELSAAARRGLQMPGRTLFMVLLAAYAIVIAAHDRVRDVVVGAPITYRPEPSLEAVVGCFTNTLALRVDLFGDPTLDTLLDRVAGVCIDGYAHADVPYEDVVRAVAARCGGDRRPLFQAVLGQQRVRPRTMRAGDLTMVRDDVHSGTVQFPLLLDVLNPHGGAPECAWEYDRRRFTVADLDGIRDDLDAVLAAMAGDRGVRVEAVCERLRRSAVERARQRAAHVRGSNDDRLRRRAAGRTRPVGAAAPVASAPVPPTSGGPEE